MAGLSSALPPGQTSPHRPPRADPGVHAKETTTFPSGVDRTSSTVSGNVAGPWTGLTIWLLNHHAVLTDAATRTSASPQIAKKKSRLRGRTRTLLTIALPMRIDLDPFAG
jgi:hypothetical protein